MDKYNNSNKEINEYLKKYYINSYKEKFNLEKMTTDKKVIFLKMIGTYRKIINICNVPEELESLEKTVYNKCNVKTDDEKIKLELKRIESNLCKKKNLSDDILDDIENIIKCYILYKNSNLKDRKKLLEDIYECIIIIELKLEMNVGLYKELCDVVEKKMLLLNVKDEFDDNNKLRR